MRSKDAEALENVKQDVTVTYKGKNNAERQRTVYWVDEVFSDNDIKMHINTCDLNTTNTIPVNLKYTSFIIAIMQSSTIIIFNISQNNVSVQFANDYSGITESKCSYKEKLASYIDFLHKIYYKSFVTKRTPFSALTLLVRQQK